MTLTALHDVPAPAKLNLFLHVTARRPDGYHLLQSLFALIDWCDTLHVECRADGRLARHDLTEPLPDDDLCLRAARALQQASGTPLGADISIDKRIPTGAGLGGGSSDAASTLLALNRLWNLRWPLARLLPIGLSLGADVPFFLSGHNATVEGIGERLTPVELPAQWFAVLKPAASIATRELFAHPAVVRNSEAVIIEGFGQSGEGRNDLQAAAEAICPDVRVAGEALQRLYGNSRMTGSGSAVFARVGAVVEGGECVDSRPSTPELPKLPELAGSVGRMCRGLLRHPLVGW